MNAPKSNYASLLDIFPGSSLREPIHSSNESWSSFNPSIAFSPLEGYKMILRTSNYSMDVVGRYIVGEDFAWNIETINRLCTLDSNLNIVGMDDIDDSTVDGPILYPHVRHMEDARLVWKNDEWHTYGTLRQHREDGNCEIAEDTLQHAVVTDRVIYDSPFAGATQKNWTYLNENQFVYFFNPPSIYSIKTGEVLYNHQHAINLQPETGNLRGSSQAIPYQNGYLTVTHEVAWRSLHRSYYHRFVQLDSDGWIRSFTKPFYFVKHGIEFACGLAPYQDGFVISFGLEESRCVLATVPGEAVQNALLPATI